MYVCMYVRMCVRAYVCTYPCSVQCVCSMVLWLCMSSYCRLGNKRPLCIIVHVVVTTCEDHYATIKIILKISWTK
ncbi:hypothetical protein BDF19DRAFT_446553 [Syncephalis fuscata]|nr:hypothetical protein BDF19DRAFT_446553 [Syncephalis fuscata]